jgi:hypothetical protein
MAAFVSGGCERPDRPAGGSIQNGSSRLLISRVFLPRSVPNRHLQDALRTKCFFGTSVPNIALSHRYRSHLLARGMRPSRSGGSK